MIRPGLLMPMILSLALAAAPALAQNTGFGNAQDTKLPVEVTSEQLSVDQKTGVANLHRQGGDRARARCGWPPTASP